MSIVIPNEANSDTRSIATTFYGNSITANPRQNYELNLTKASNLNILLEKYPKCETFNMDLFNPIIRNNDIVKT